MWWAFGSAPDFWSRVRIRQWSWCAAGSLCNNAKILRVERETYPWGKKIFKKYFECRALGPSAPASGERLYASLRSQLLCNLAFSLLQDGRVPLQIQPFHNLDRIGFNYYQKGTVRRSCCVFIKKNNLCSTYTVFIVGGIPLQIEKDFNREAGRKNSYCTVVLNFISLLPNKI